MARGQAKSNIKNDRRLPPEPKDQGKWPQGVKKQQTLRKSPRLQAIRQPHKQSLSKSNHIQEVQTPVSPPAGNIPESRNASQNPHFLHIPSNSPRKRKRGQYAAHRSPPTQDQPPSKRLQAKPSSCTAEKEPHPGAATDTNGNSLDPLQYWIQTGKWHKKYFEQDSQVREDLEQDSWLGEPMENSTQVVEYVEINGYRYPRPIKRLSASLRRKQSESNLTGSSDQTKRENKSAPYRTARYTTLLAAKGSFMDKSDLNITDASKSLCRRLLESEQDVPKDSLFRDDLFERTCRKIQDRNEARVIQDISRLIVPSAETLATYGATHLDHLIEGVNEAWMGSIPVEGPKPQPDYSVGFRRSAFTDEQLKKLDPLIGSVFDTSFFVATYRMYFPFLTCEVKCGATALDIADRQNAHSMTVAVRALVQLYKAVKREKELDQEILAFSISHDHRSVRIYGHYAIIKEDKTTFYRHPIHAFDFTVQDGKEKWTAYKFAKNIYNKFMPLQHKRICSAIDDLPSDINFDLSQSACFSQSGPENSQQTNAESILGEDDNQSSFLASQEATLTTSFTQTTERASKKPRNQGAASP